MKETTSKVKKQPLEWEKIIPKEATDKELISNISKQLTHAPQYQKNKCLNQKIEEMGVALSHQKNPKCSTLVQSQK